MVVIASTSAFAGANTAVYVSTQGDDANPGTREQPIKSLQQVEQAIRDRPEVIEVVFAPGAYYGTLNVSRKPDTAPDQVNPLTIRAAAGGDVDFIGSVTVREAQRLEHHRGVYFLETSAYLTRGKPSVWSEPQMWEQDTRTRYTRVADPATVYAAVGTFCPTRTGLMFHTSDHRPPAEHDIGIAHHGSGMTIGSEPHVPAVTVRGIRFHHYVNNAINLDKSDSTIVDCIAINSARGYFIGRNAAGVKVLNCTSHDCGGGIYVNGSNCHVENGRFIKNRDAFIYPVYPQDDSGIQYYYPAKGGVIRGNLCKGFENGIYIKTDQADYLVEHNTLIDNRNSFVRTANHPGTVVRHNIIKSRQQGDNVFGYYYVRDDGFSIVENCLWGPDAQPFLESVAKGDGLDGGAREATRKYGMIVADPRFADPEAGDYRLLTDSPCVQIKGRPWGALPVVESTFRQVKHIDAQAGADRLANVKDEPRLIGAPSIRANDYGVVIACVTDQPCRARVEYGLTTDYGQTAHAPPALIQTWRAQAPSELGNQWSTPWRSDHAAVILSPHVQRAKTYHFRLHLENESGRTWVTEDGTFVVRGKAGTVQVWPRGAGPADSVPLQQAVDTALPGDRVVLNHGVYTGALYISHGGVLEAPLTIESQTTGAAVLDGLRRTHHTVRIENAAHLILKGLEIRWTTQHYGSSNVKIVNAPHVSMVGCKVWNHGWHMWPIGDGVRVSNSRAFTMTRCLVMRQETGVILSNSPRATFTMNTMVRNLYAATRYSDGSETGSIQRDNSFCENGNDVYVLNELPTQGPSFVSDYNNLGAYLYRQPEDKRLTFKDPWMRSDTKAVIYYGAGYEDGKNRFGTLAQWRAFSGQDVHSIFADPMYVDVKHHDVRLLADSANIGAGKNGGDIGACGIRQTVTTVQPFHKNAPLSVQHEKGSVTELTLPDSGLQVIDPKGSDVSSRTVNVAKPSFASPWSVYGRADVVIGADEPSGLYTVAPMVGPTSSGQWTWFETTGQTKWVVEMGSRVVTGHRGIRIRVPNGTGRFAARDGSHGRFRLTMPNGETFDSDGYTITVDVPAGVGGVFEIVREKAPDQPAAFSVAK